MEKNIKNFFFAFELETIWEDDFKDLKVIDKKNRHLTLLFLGENNFNEIKKYLDQMSNLNIQIGSVGYFEKVIFLPENNPRAAAYKANFLNDELKIKNYQKELISFFKNKEINLKKEKDFLPHVTISRDKFDKKELKNKFIKAPFYIKSFNLYESLFSSNYKSLWKKEYLAPFKEIEHTADIAFEVVGIDCNQLLLNAFTAICFKEFKMLDYINLLKKVSSIDEIIINLNEILTQMEIDGYQAFFKAISLNQKTYKKNNLIFWEMVIDV
jgi:2'-5' RNA ligase